MSAEQHCVIVGAGHAASHLALSLRKLAWPGRITVVGDEPHLPYHRPPLSKNYLLGGKTLQQILLRPATAYESANVELLLSTRVNGVDRKLKTVSLSSGKTLSYSHLVFATGASPRELPVAGADLKGVCYLRSADDIESIKKRALPGGRAVIIGGGYIGLEAAATLRKIGLKVTIVESTERLLQRVAAPPLSQFFARLHEEEGAAVLTSTSVNRLLGDSSVCGAELSSKETIDADLVVIGIGVIPNTALAESIGLKTDNGIVVDKYCQTDDPAIFACGDCANGFHDFYSRELRLESVQNANDQALTVARSICGQQTPYSSVPWFWSDQYDVKLQIAGLQTDCNDMVVRGSPSSDRKFSIMYLNDSVLISADAVNSPIEFVGAKRLIAGRKKIDIAKLRDADQALSECCVE